MFNISFEKQSLIMAQSATRLAVEIAISCKKQEEKEFIKEYANYLYSLEMELAGTNIETIKEISRDSREKTIESMIADIKDKHDIFKINEILTVEEQIKYKDILKKNLNKYK